MAKMNYSNFKEDECEIIPVESAEVLPANTSYNLLNNSSHGNGQALANAVSPVAAITNCISMSLDTISKCIAAVSIEKQKTEQVKAEMNAKIIESKQQTERVKIHEKAETKRLIVSCEFNLKNQKIEMEKLRDKYKFKTYKREVSHSEYMESLTQIEKTVDELMKTTKFLRNAFLQETDFSQKEVCLHNLNQANMQLVEITKQLISAKGMK